jgi:DnaJ-class molecular chaperone
MGRKRTKWRQAKLGRAKCLRCGGSGAVKADNGILKNCPRCDGTGKEAKKG